MKRAVIQASKIQRFTVHGCLKDDIVAAEPRLYQVQTLKSSDGKRPVGSWVAGGAVLQLRQAWSEAALGQNALALT